MSEAHQHGATGLDAGTRHWGREPVSGIFLGMASLVAQLLKNPPAMQETPVRFLGWKDNLEKDRLPIPVFLSFPGGSDSKESACNVGDLASIPGLGRSPGEGNSHPLQDSGLESSVGGMVSRTAELGRTERLSLSCVLLSLL